MAFSFEPLEIPDVVLVRPGRYEDARGFFCEIYRESAFVQGGITARFVQDNVARSKRGVLRGLHYQIPPAAQGKLVWAARGEIYDVAVDLRAGSPTRGRWVGRRLDERGGDLLWIPPGFAHGYAVLSETADIVYKVTAEYAPELDRGIAWDDPDIGIEWPFDDPGLSARDRAQPRLIDADTPFSV